MRYFKEEYWEQFTKVIKTKGSEKEKIIRDGLEFEKLIQKLLFLKFQGRWNGTKTTHDLNRDFYLYYKEERVWAECKNYQDSIAMSTIAPTLVMAQIFDIERIIFFSYSPINDNAKRKIFSFGRKVNKKIQIFDDYKLEELIMEVGDGLPSKYRPQLLEEEKKITDNEVDIQLFIRTEPFLAVDDEMTDFLIYDSVKKIYYNKTFALYFFFTNTSALKNYEIKIQINETSSPDLRHFHFIENGMEKSEEVVISTKIECAEGAVLQRLLKPIIYKNQLVLPVFKIDVLENGKVLYTWQNKAITLNCAWIGHTKLLGSNYENVLDKIEDIVLHRDKLGIAAIYGESGTGKTRLLVELMDKLLKHRYGILNFIGTESDSSLNILKEILYFLYEIPKGKLVGQLEIYLSNHTKEDATTSASKGILLMYQIMHCENELELEGYYDIIFEKISRLKLAVIFDNVQYYNDSLNKFILKYIQYSQNQVYANHSVFICSFNTDFMTNSASTILNSIRTYENTTDCVYSKKISGFRNESQSILFLRELIHIDSEENDLLFSMITKKMTTKPYYLYQAVKYLEEENCIFRTPTQQGFIIDNNKFSKAVNKMPDSINNLLRKRYEKLLEDYKSESCFLIISTIYLFGRLNNFISKTLDLDDTVINGMLEKGFLVKNVDQTIEFQHDIIRTFFFL